MQGNQPFVVFACLAFGLSACGADDESRVTQVEPSPVLELPQPIQSLPRIEPQGLDALRASIRSGAEPGFLAIPVEVQTGFEPVLTAYETVAYTDSRIRLLGGRHATGSTWPRMLFWWPQALSAIAAPVYESAGFSSDRSSVVDGFEFVLPVDQQKFELFSIDDGYINGVYVEIDGARTSKSPISLGHGNSGSLRYSLVTLPASDKARTIRIISTRATLGEIRLPQGQTIGLRRTAWDRKPKVAFVGDFITEGEGAGHASDSWAMQLAYRLGVDDPIIIALGGTGYLKRIGTRPNFREHIADVLDAFGSRRPDVVIVAGGINDCNNFAPAEIQAEAGTYFAALRAAAPQMAIIVFGPFSGPNGYDDVSTRCAEAIFAGAETVQGTYPIDVSGWVTPSTAPNIFDGDRLGPHPVRTGHTHYAKMGERAIRALLESTP